MLPKQLPMVTIGDGRPYLAERVCNPKVQKFFRLDQRFLLFPALDCVLCSLSCIVYDRKQRNLVMAKKAPNADQTTPPTDANGGAPADQNKDTLMSDTALSTVTLKIADMDITLPVKFAAGHTLSDNEAKILDAAFQRQFTNNQNANQKNREKAGKALLTAQEITDAYADYVPTVGDGVRQSALEKMQNDAGWNAYVTMVTEHNANLGAGIIPKANGKAVALPTKPVRDANGKVTQTLQERRDAISATMRSLPQYAERVQAELDKLVAQRGTKAPEATAELVEGDVL